MKDLPDATRRAFKNVESNHFFESDFLVGQCAKVICKGGVAVKMFICSGNCAVDSYVVKLLASPRCVSTKYIRGVEL